MRVDLTARRGAALEAPFRAQLTLGDALWMFGSEALRTGWLRFNIVHYHFESWGTMPLA